MDIRFLSRFGYLSTFLWALVLCAAIVVTISLIGRGALNLKAALTEKPDIAIYLLLPDEDIASVDLLREEDEQRDYLIQTADGKKLVILKKGEEEWYVAELETMHE